MLEISTTAVRDALARWVVWGLVRVLEDVE